MRIGLTITVLLTFTNMAMAQSGFMIDLDKKDGSSPNLSEARNGQGGQMQDCGIQPGPVAYNIGSSTGSGVKGECRPRSIVVGFNGSFAKLPPGTIGMGYINPRLEKPSMINQFPGETRSGGDEWNEPIYKDYSSKGAVDYIAHQVNHWKKEGRKRGQKCVAVDVDNCDVIKAENYRKVLDTIDRLNRQDPSVQIRVLVKNPQNAGCGQFLKRSVAIGGFMEELSASDAERVDRLRANPNQVLVFARGNNRGGAHISMDSLDRKRIPNSTVSHDSNGSYNSITRCTYHPGGAPRGEALVGQGDVAR